MDRLICSPPELPIQLPRCHSPCPRICTVLILRPPAKPSTMVHWPFGRGILASATSAAKNILHAGNDEGCGPRRSWNANNVILTGTVELYTGIIVSSVPAASPFISRYNPQFLDDVTKITEPPAGRYGYLSLALAATILSIPTLRPRRVTFHHSSSYLPSYSHLP